MGLVILHSPSHLQGFNADSSPPLLTGSDFGNSEEVKQRQWRMATSFFISNLPKLCDIKKVREELQGVGTLVDVFIVTTRLGKNGCRFGSVRFNRVQCVQKMVGNLNKKYIGGKKIFASMAKFKRLEKIQVQQVKKVSCQNSNLEYG
ncbi:hypothetical protein LXL04_029408 [Taraxacum kok-saghyz]